METRTARMSRLQWLLPVAIAVLLLTVSTAVVGLAYLESRRGAEAAARTRLSSIAGQLTDVVEQSAASLRTQSMASAASPQIVGVLEGTTSIDEARTRFEPVLRTANQVFAIELWRADGTRAFELKGERAPPVVEAPGTFPPWAKPDDVAFSMPYVTDGPATYASVTPVRSGGELKGYLLIRRRVLSPVSSNNTIAQLIGSGSRVLLGGPDTGWANLLQRDAAHVHDTITPDEAGVYWTTTSDRWLGVTSAITGSPWQLRVEFPEDVVVDLPHQLLRNIIGVALLVTAIGTFVGWLISRRLTVPLRALTDAAVVIAEGTGSPTVPLARNDEIGVLTTAFNVMVDKVASARRDLERRVEERTEELGQALTDARTAEQTMREYAARLETSNRELEAFSYTISHDLRAPLRSIDGFTEALLVDCGAQLDEQGTGYLTRVRKSVKRMDMLIDDLLELARVSRVEVVPREVSLTTIARRIVQELRDRTPERRVDIQIQDGLIANGDPKLLSLVLQNLLDNAWKFTSTRPHAIIEVRGDPAGAPTTFVVRDNGVGFDMAEAGKIFGIFQRLHSLDQFPGTGVGLAIVHRVITRHGGRFWVDAKPDAGATFSFTLGAAA